MHGFRGDRSRRMVAVESDKEVVGDEEGWIAFVEKEAEECMVAVSVKEVVDKEASEKEGWLVEIEAEEWQL